MVHISQQPARRAVVMGEKDRKLLILNIPFWHPESFVVSADRKKKAH